MFVGHPVGTVFENLGRRAERAAFLARALCDGVQLIVEDVARVA